MRECAPIPRSDSVDPALPSNVAAAIAAATAWRSGALNATPSSGGNVASVITMTSAPLAGALAAKPIARSALLAAVAGTTPDPVTDCAKADGVAANDRHAARSRLL